MKIGIVGAGRIAKAHLKKLKQIEGIEITAICDTIKEKSKELSEDTGATAYIDLKEMVERESIDALWICTPANVHSENVLLCLERNIPFFLEKPVTVDIHEGKEIEKKVKEKNILNSVGYIWRYMPASDKLKEILSREKLALVATESLWTIPLVDSIKSKENAGGQIVDQATHFIDLMRYTIGEISSVYTRRIKGLFPEESLYTGDDASATVFQFENGVVGNLICTYALFPTIGKYYPCTLRFICKNKLIEYKPGKIKIITPDGDETIEIPGDAMLLEDKSFLKGLKEKNTAYIKSDYIDAYKTLKVSLAANESMETGEKVEL